MPLKTSTDGELPAINLTPMIDVVFLLLIFFMVGTQFTQQERQIDINLPGVGAVNSMLPVPQRREVLIAPNGTAYLDGQAVSVRELMQRLTEMKRRYPDLAVAVRADAEAKQRDVIPIYGAINSAGIANMAVLGLQNEKLR